MKEKLEQALDAIWVIHGNGFGTEWERLVSELQNAIERIEQNDQIHP